MGYTGGKAAYPTYSRLQDQTEAIRVEYDPSIISYEDILEHYSIQLGSPLYESYSRQYRNAILYHNAEQRDAAISLVKKLGNKYKGKQIYIDIEPAVDFYRAEEYHQKYIEKQHRRIESRR